MEIAKVDRNKYFNIQQSICLDEQEYDQVWKQTSNFWVADGSNRMKNGTWTRYYKCRLANHKKSSSPVKAVDGRVIKRRKATRAIKGLCDAKLTVVNKGKEYHMVTKGDHKHSIEDSDRRKLPVIVKEVIADEIMKGYEPKNVCKAVKNFDLPAAHIVRTRTVANIKAKLKPNSGIYTALKNVNDDCKEASKTVNLLLSSGDLYFSKVISIVKSRGSKETIVGFAWSRKDFGELMMKHGHLVQMDSTHTTNKFGWKLFTILFREENGFWLPGAHFLIEEEDKDNVELGLNAVKEGLPKWKPRYFVIDRSQIETAAIDAVFPGGEEVKPDIFYCTVHLNRNLLRKVPMLDVRSKLILAIKALTKERCKKYLTEALDLYRKHHKGNFTGSGTVEKYINRMFSLEQSKMWGSWNRAKSVILLQCNNTNQIESYHSQLQSDGLLDKKSGLSGVIYGTQQTAKKRIELRNALIFKQKHKESRIIQHFPLLKALNHNAQIMVYDEYIKALDNIDKGKVNKYTLNSASCRCEFFIKYYLPCKHIFYEENVNPGFITSDNWESFLDGWEESGYDVYWNRESTFYPYEESQAIDEARPFKVGMERATELYYDMAEANQTAPFMDLFQEFIDSAEALKQDMLNSNKPISKRKRKKNNWNFK